MRRRITFPARIPRERAIAALELANAIIDLQDNAEPGDPAGDHDLEVTADSWRNWLRLARIAAADRRCRVCGCVEEDCADCIAKTGEPCSWVEKDLCSACVPVKKSKKAA